MLFNSLFFSENVAAYTEKWNSIPDKMFYYAENINNIKAHDNKSSIHNRRF